MSGQRTTAASEPHPYRFMCTCASCMAHLDDLLAASRNGVPPPGHASGEALRAAMAAKAAEGQAAAKRRAANEVDGARCALAAMLEGPLSDPTGAPAWVYVARLRERLDDMRAAVDRWAWLHEPCGCAEQNERDRARGLGNVTACPKCPAGEP